MPVYADKSELKRVHEKLERLPPLVFAGEISVLQKRLEAAAKGEAFILQGGDCAETFHDVSANNVRDMFQLFLHMAVILMYGSGRSVVKIGRIAGQFAKPRSSDTETRDGVTLPSYRGDIVNAIEFTEEARQPDPSRMLDAYLYSASVLNLVRAFIGGGYADVDRIANFSKWNTEIFGQLLNHDRYQKIFEGIERIQAFVRACGVCPDSMHTAEFFTSHEALLLPYEEALTRLDTIVGSRRYLAGSAHMLWIGERTRQLDGAHVEFCRGVLNPLGIKCGPTIEPDELLSLIDILNPDNEEGRIVLIIRMGINKIEERLPVLIRAVVEHGKNVVWSSDPMHGNTITSTNLYKTRKFDDILRELKSFFAIHRALGTHAGGVHLEMTHAVVTECIGGNECVSEACLEKRYLTTCDPRLNAAQVMEIALLIAEELLMFRQGA
jgi:3-deoxy-7-phosphoheptulonate synthase